jgi:hypothetical protein
MRTWKTYLNESVGLYPLGSGTNIDIEDGKPITIKASIKSKYAKQFSRSYRKLSDLTDAVVSAFEKVGIVPLSSDSGETWVGSFTGSARSEKTEAVKVPLSKDGKLTKNMGIINIYKLPNGDYELNTYIS